MIKVIFFANVLKYFKIGVFPSVLLVILWQNYCVMRKLNSTYTSKASSVVPLINNNCRRVGLNGDSQLANFLRVICARLLQNGSKCVKQLLFLRVTTKAFTSILAGNKKIELIDYQQIINVVLSFLRLWALTDSNRRPSACKADALNQLS